MVRPASQLSSFFQSIRALFPKDPDSLSAGQEVALFCSSLHQERVVLAATVGVCGFSPLQLPLPLPPLAVCGRSSSVGSTRKRTMSSGRYSRVLSTEYKSELEPSGRADEWPIETRADKENTRKRFNHRRHFATGGTSRMAPSRAAPSRAKPPVVPIQPRSRFLERSLSDRTVVAETAPLT